MTILVCSDASFCQSSKASSLPLSFEWVTRNAEANSSVHLFVEGSKSMIESFVLEHDGRYKYSFKDYHAIILNTDKVKLLAKQDYVDHIHFEHGSGQPLLNSSLSQTNARWVHDGSHGLPEAYLGEGVIVGVIDAGIELQHPDFMNADSTTRILELWDHTMGFDALRTPSYGYGQVWDSTDINAGICPHEDQTDYFGHGTNTAGIAAGNGQSNPDFVGYAPKSDLIIVSTDFDAIGWTNTIADAVDYIFKRAEAYGKPCVINASVGTYLGSHDATDLAAKAIENDVLSSTGRIMVCAAGNAGAEAPFHLGYEASNDTTFTWFKTKTGAIAGQASIFFEMYGDKQDFERVQFAIGADQVVGGYAYRGSVAYDSVLNRMNIIYADSLESQSGSYIAKVKTYADSLNGVYRLQVLIDSIDSVDYRFRLNITGSGRFDLWSAEWLKLQDMVSSGLPNATAFPDIVNYRLPDSKQQIVSSWACSPQVMTVGNAINRMTYTDVDANQVTISGVVAGSIAANSSQGPTRMGDRKPDVVAPGDFTLTAGAFYQLDNLLGNAATRNRVAPGGLHHRAGGTSSASPAVAGTAALFLEKCSNADWSDFKNAVNNNTIADAFTGTVPNDVWGYGKLDALAALKATTPNTNIEYVKNEFCEGDTVVLELEVSFPTMTWSTGATGPLIYVTSTDQYFVEVIDDKNCLGRSDTISVFERPIPTKPTLELSSDTPACSDQLLMLSLDQTYGAYKWSNGVTNDELQVMESDYYFCEVRNGFNCKNWSDTSLVRIHPPNAPIELALQAKDRLVLSTSSDLVDHYLWYRNGVLVSDETDSTFHVQNVGYYLGGYVDLNGCREMSNYLQVLALGDKELGLETEKIMLYPNPVVDLLNVKAPDDYKNWRVYDVDGRLCSEGYLQPGLSQINTQALPEGVYSLELIGVQKAHRLFVK